MCREVIRQARDIKEAASYYTYTSTKKLKNRTYAQAFFSFQSPANRFLRDEAQVHGTFPFVCPLRLFRFGIPPLLHSLDRKSCHGRRKPRDTAVTTGATRFNHALIDLDEETIE